MEGAKKKFVKTIFKANGNNILTFNNDLTKYEMAYIKCLIFEFKKCKLSDISVEKMETDKDYSDISISPNGDIILVNVLENTQITKISSFDYFLDYYNIFGLKDIEELIYFL